MEHSVPMISSAMLSLIVSVISQSVIAGSPSFDCERASTWSEIEVCRDETLSDLDRQVAALYQDARARAEEQQKETLKGDQEAWLRKREECQDQPNQSECLQKVYATRISQLGSAGSQQPAGDMTTNEPVEANHQSAPLPEFTANVIWHDAADVYEKCDHADFDCVVSLMKSGGASDEAVRFVERAEAWAIEFNEFGRVDLLTAETFRANTNVYPLLVNGSPEIVNVGGYRFAPDDKARPDLRNVLEAHPEAFLIARPTFDRYESVGNGSRFVFVDVVASCRACKPLARVEIGYAFDGDGAFQKATFLGIVATGPEDTGHSEAAEATPQGQSAQEATQADRTEVVDGSTLVGTIKDARVPFTSSFGVVEVTLPDISSFAEGKLSLSDGSVLKGQFDEHQIEISTGNGELTVRTQDIVSITRGSDESPAAEASVQPAAGQGLLIGRVVDNFRMPVLGASVRILGSSLETTTDQDGSYRLQYVPGQVRVRIALSGYDSVEFELSLSEASHYPVEEKELLRLPPHQGIFYWDKEGWSRLPECTVKQTSQMIVNGNIDFRGVRKDAYWVAGSAFRVMSSGRPMFLANVPNPKNFLIYRVNEKDEIVTRSSGGGLTGFAGMLSNKGAKKGTSLARGWRTERFPKRYFYYTENNPGVYVLIERGYKQGCFKFQIGNTQPQARQDEPGKPVATEAISVDGRTVSYWRSPSQEKHARFSFESKGYRNTYLLDCTNKRFLWTENVRLSTGNATGNSAGAAWRSMNPKSTIANTVFDAICPSIVSGEGKAPEKETHGDSEGGGEDGVLRIGSIGNTSIVGDCNCSVNPVSKSGERVFDQYIFASDYKGNARMNIDGSDVDLRETGRKESPGILARCSQEDCMYSADGVIVRADYRETSRCPPEPTECEVTGYDVTITVEKNGKEQKVLGKGVCGC